MADEKPILNEVAAIGGDDIGAKFADQLRLPDDDILGARGSNDLVLYERVFTDPQAKSTFDQRRTAVVSREWYVEPGGDSALDIAAADDLRAQLQGFNWDLVTRKMLMGIWYGYSVGEVMYAVQGTKYVMSDIKVRKARRFRFDREDKLRLITRATPEGTTMPDNKFWLFRVAAEDDDDPYGRGLGYFCYWPVWFKRNGWRYWSQFLQRFGSPIPIASVAPGSDKTFRDKVLNMLSAIISGGRMVKPNNIAIEFLQAASSSGGDFETFSRYCDEQIAKINLAQTMTTDSGSSRAQAVVHAEVKLEVIKSDADMLCESFNAGPVTWLTNWNHPGALPPKVWRRVVSAVDLAAQATRDKTLYEIGYDATPEYVRETYGTGFTQRKPSTDTATEPSEDEPTEPAFAEPGADMIGPGSDAVEQAVGGDEWRRLMGPEVDALEALTRDAGDLITLRERLGEYAQRDPKAVADSLARVMFAAHVAGQLGTELEPPEQDGDG